MRRLPFLFLAAFVTAADLVTKSAVFAWLARHDVPSGRVRFLLGRWFGVTRIMNPGVTGGMGSGIDPGILTGFTVVAVLGIALYLLLPKQQSRWTSFALAFVLGGAVGNLFDRFAYHEVRDFIDVWPRLFHSGWLYHWPTFNVADSAIVTGVVLLVFHSLFLAKDEAREKTAPAEAS